MSQIQMPFTTPVDSERLSVKPLWDTEPVFIQSSPQRMGQGPARRVLCCRNNVFLSLRTPESPTVVYLAEKRHRKLGQAITKTKIGEPVTLLKFPVGL